MAQTFTPTKYQADLIARTAGRYLPRSDGGYPWARWEGAALAGIPDDVLKQISDYGQPGSDAPARVAATAELQRRGDAAIVRKAAIAAAKQGRQALAASVLPGPAPANEIDERVERLQADYGGHGDLGIVELDHGSSGRQENYALSPITRAIAGPRPYAPPSPVKHAAQAALEKAQREQDAKDAAHREAVRKRFSPDESQVYFDWRTGLRFRYRGGVPVAVN